MTKDPKNLDRAFNPRTVAVVGDKLQSNYMWLRGVSNFQGKVYSVQIDPREIPNIEAMGIPNYLSLLDIPDSIDYVICAVPRAASPRIVQDCITKGVGAVHLFTSGFAETGTEEGIRLQNIITEMAKAGKLNLIGPNCMGIYNPRIGLRVFGPQPESQQGVMGFISQSGTQLGAFTRAAQQAGIGVSKAVSYGNAVVLDSSDYLQYLAEDDETKVIGMYIEGVKDGRRFFQCLRETANKKPVIVWKGGQTEDSARAIASHTASLAVPGVIWDTIIRQCGAIKANGIEELLDIAKGLLYLAPPQGARLGLIAVSGGHSVEMADAFSLAGFRVPALSDESYQQLSSFFNIIGGSYRNPLEGGGNMAFEERLVTVLDILDKDDNVDAIVMELGGVGRGQPGSDLWSRRLQTLSSFRKKTNKPFLTTNAIGTPGAGFGEMSEFTNKLMESDIPSFPSFRRCADALKKIMEYYNFHNSESLPAR